LERLADAIEAGLSKELSIPALEKYDEIFEEQYSMKMHKKLGLFKVFPEDKGLFQRLLHTLEYSGADYTNSLRGLNKMDLNDPNSDNLVIQYLVSQCCQFKTLLNRFAPRIPESQLEMMMLVAQQNPEVLTRLGLQLEMLQDEFKRLEKFNELKKMNQQDKSESDTIIWTEWIQLYRKRLELEVEGVEDKIALQQKRITLMNSNNPKFILRNYIAQEVIDKAEKEDYSELHRIHELLKDPYGEGTQYAEFKYDALPPEWAADLCVT